MQTMTTSALASSQARFAPVPNNTNCCSNFVEYIITSEASLITRRWQDLSVQVGFDEVCAHLTQEVGGGNWTLIMSSQLPFNLCCCSEVNQPGWCIIRLDSCLFPISTSLVNVDLRFLHDFSLSVSVFVTVYLHFQRNRIAYTLTCTEIILTCLMYEKCSVRALFILSPS